MLIAGLFSFLSNSVLNAIASGFADAANAILLALVTQINAATSLSLTGNNFVAEFDAVFGIAVFVTLFLAMLELGAAALQRNGPRVMKVPLNVLVMIAGTTASVAIIQILLNMVDQLGAGLMSAVGFSPHGLLKLGTEVTALAATDPVMAMLMGMALIFAVLAIVVSLIVRKVLIVVAVVFAPLALAGATAQSTRGWVRKWIETTLALIFSKLILVILLITSFHLMEGAGSSNGTTALTSLIGGIGLFSIAAFSPIMAMKMVSFTGGHFAEAATVGHQGASSVAKPAQIASDAGAAYATGGASAALGSLAKRAGFHGGVDAPSGEGRPLTKTPATKSSDVSTVTGGEDTSGTPTANAETSYDVPHPDPSHESHLTSSGASASSSSTAATASSYDVPHPNSAHESHQTTASSTMSTASTGAAKDDTRVSSATSVAAHASDAAAPAETLVAAPTPQTSSAHPSAPTPTSSSAPAPSPSGAGIAHPSPPESAINLASQAPVASSSTSSGAGAHPSPPSAPASSPVTPADTPRERTNTDTTVPSPPETP